MVPSGRPCPPRRRPLLAVLGVVLALGACGGSDDPTMGGASANASCVPGGDRLVVSSQDIKFDPECLAAPADRPFSIVFANKENLPHDIDVVKADDSSQKLFDGEIFSGRKTVTYQVPPLPPGRYTFECSVHRAQMHGTLRVG